MVNPGSNQHRTTADARCIGGLILRNHVGCDDLPFDLGDVFELLDQFILGVHIEKVDLQNVSITNTAQHNQNMGPLVYSPSPCRHNRRLACYSMP